jgi:hypothetical protein
MVIINDVDADEQGTYYNITIYRDELNVLSDALVEIIRLDPDDNTGKKAQEILDVLNKYLI